MLTQISLPPAPPAIVAPITESSRDEFPACRNWRAGQPKPPGCRRRAQTRQYWLQLDNATTLERQVIDAEVTEGYIPGEGGEIKRLETLVAAAMPGWEITGLQLADEPDTEF